jgi:hypothetical protein
MKVGPTGFSQLSENQPLANKRMLPRQPIGTAFIIEND